MCVVVACQVALFFVPSFDKVGYVEHGCYIGDALIIYVECQGFPGSSVVGFVLSLPYALMFAPFFVVWGLSAGPFFWPKGLILVIYGLALWAPVAYLFWHGLPSLVRRLLPAAN